MAKVSVPVGEMVTLRLGLRGNAYRVRVLDVSDSLILLRVPAELEAARSVHHVSLEFTTDEQAHWSVPTHVHSMLERWWYLARPEESRCQLSQRRVFPRVSLALDMLAIPVNAELQQDGDPFTLSVLDLSASGCRVATDRLVRAGARFVLVLGLPGSEGIPTIAEVVRTDGHDGERYRYGLHFLNLRSDYVERINGFVETRIESVIAVSVAAED